MMVPRVLILLPAGVCPHRWWCQTPMGAVSLQSSLCVGHVPGHRSFCRGWSSRRTCALEEVSFACPQAGEEVARVWE